MTEKCPSQGNDWTGGGPGIPPNPDQQGHLPVAILVRLHIIDGVVWLLIAVIPAIVLIAAVFNGEPEALLFGIPAIGLLALPATGHLVCAQRLRGNKPGGQKLLTVLSWLGLLRVPFGTVSSILTLTALRRARRGQAGTTGSWGKFIALFWALWQAQILFLVAALAWVNATAASSRSHVKRTMSDMRSIATAVEAYSTDYNVYPKARSVEELAPVISPVYIREFPFKDGWDRPWRYETSVDGQSYVIVSAGKDGRFEQTSPWAYQRRSTTSHDEDIVFRDGMFIRAEGLDHVEDR